MNETKTIALVGNQNCGKSTLFNVLTGGTQRVGNFPGVTVEEKKGALRSDETVTVIDLPGTYSLFPYTEEEAVTRAFLLTDKPDLILNIIDATSLSRSLYLSMQLLELQLPLVIAINMMDEVEKDGGKIDVKLLSEYLRVPIVPISALQKSGITELLQIMRATLHAPTIPATYALPLSYEEIKKKIGFLLQEEAKKQKRSVSFMSSEFLCDVLDCSLLDEQTNKQLLLYKRQFEAISGMDSVAAFIDGRYQEIDKLVQRVSTSGIGKEALQRSKNIDRLLTHPTFAIPLFFVIMGIIFWLTFGPVGGTLQRVLGELLEAIGAWGNQLFLRYAVTDWLRGLCIEGAYHGVSSVLSFAPVILTLFFLLSLLEDSGYMARVAYVMDGLLRKLGLSGKSFVPLLLGFGCSVPAIVSTRTIAEHRERLMTMMLIPFVSCPAKLPIYTMIAMAIFPGKTAFLLILLYTIGLFCAVLSALFLKKTVFSVQETVFLLELPPYRWPSMHNVMKQMKEKTGDFLKRAFSVIFLSSVLIWVFSNFNRSMQYGVNPQDSILAQLSGLLSVFFLPLGFSDWRIIAALFTGITAKETVISTLSVLLQVNQQVTLLETIQGLFTPVSAFSFLLFTLLYPPCLASAAALKKESGSLKTTILILLYQLVFAWIVAYLFVLLSSIFPVVSQ